MDRHRRWFRRLLRLLPADFQADYARDMERTFRAQHREARGQGARQVMALWWETIGDLLRTAPRQHVDQTRQDARYALRTMARTPGFTAASVLVLAIGIGTTTAVFTLVDVAVLRPVPFPAAERLVVVREQTPQDTAGWELSYPAFLDVRRDTRVFEAFDGYTRTGFIVRGGGRPRLVDGLHASAGLIDTLGVRLEAGRSFHADEDRPGATRVAILSYALAAERFGDPRAAVDRAISIDGQATVVVGVFPPAFTYPSADVDVWMPLGMLAGERWIQDRSVHLVLPVGRLRHDATLDMARADLTRQMRTLQAAHPAADPNHRFIAQLLAHQVSAAGRPAVAALTGAVLLLLLVTCSSIGLLLLNRATGRSGEMSMRMALGASRARVVRQLLTESLLLAIAGAVPGTLAAGAVLRMLVNGLDDVLPALRPPAFTVETWLVITGVTLVTAFVCGLSPVVQVTRVPRSPNIAGAAARSRWESGLLVGQVALSCTLVLLAVLLGRSFAALMRVDPGFRTDRLLLARVTLPEATYDKPALSTTFYRGLPAELLRIPGVERVTAATRAPIGGEYNSNLTIEGIATETPPVVNFRRVLPGYFAALGVAIIEGRDFTDRDPAGEPVVIVSQTLARRYFPPGRAVGRRLKTGPAHTEPWLRVVGVAADVRNAGLDSPGDMATYEPHAQRPWNGMTVMVRTSGDPLLLAPTIEKAIRAVEPDVLVTEVETMEQRIAVSVASRRFHAVVVGCFAGATLLLAALALYGVRAWQVRVRSRELGVRSAIGASPARLTMHVVREGVAAAVFGAAIGLAGAAVGAYAIRGLLFAVTPADPTAYILTALVMIATATVASWLPARRAARIDPGLALRSQ